MYNVVHTCIYMIYNIIMKYSIFWTVTHKHFKMDRFCCCDERREWLRWKWKIFIASGQHKRTWTMPGCPPDFHCILHIWRFVHTKKYVSKVTCKIWRSLKRCNTKVIKRGWNTLNLACHLKIIDFVSFL